MRDSPCGWSHAVTELEVTDFSLRRSETVRRLEPHSCCLMAWAVHREWGASVGEVKRELYQVVTTIAEYEPNKLLVPPGEIADAKLRSLDRT